MDLIKLIDKLEKRGVNFVTLREGFDTRTPSGRFVFTISAAFAQMKREVPGAPKVGNVRNQEPDMLNSQ